MDNTETDIGDIGHTKRKTKTNKAKQKNRNKQSKTKQSHNTALKRCATRTPQTPEMNQGLLLLIKHPLCY